MNEQTVTTIALVLAAAVIAYLLGERQAARREVARTKERLAAAEAEARQTASTAPPSERPASGSASASTPPASEPPASASPASTEPAPSSSPRPTTPTLPVPSGAPAVAKLYEEDEDIDPTRVGAAASAPAPKRTIHQASVAKIVFDPDADAEEAEQPESLFFVSATAQTDKGLRRKRNEDSLGVLESKSLFIVADGMGGYAGGELASRLAVDTMIEAYKSGSFEGPAHEELSRDGSELARAIQMANAAIGEEAAKNKALEGMGTTLVAAKFSPKLRRLHIGHVGDSRCYRLRDEVLTQITADHTMSELGVTGPESQKLSRAVGIWPTVPIDVVAAIPQAGDVYLLCSDGLTKMLKEDMIKHVLRTEEDPKIAVERLILFANSRGGKDNITVVLVRVVPPNWRPKPSEPFSPASVPPPSGNVDEPPPPSMGPPAGAAYGHGRKPPSKS
jgi:protein phosphatase